MPASGVHAVGVPLPAMFTQVALFALCGLHIQVVLDGELLGFTPVSAKVLPASLKVLVPAPKPAAEPDLVHRLAKQESLDEAVAELVIEELGDEAPAAVAGLEAEAEAKEIVSTKVEESKNVENHPIVKPKDE